MCIVSVQTLGLSVFMCLVRDRLPRQKLRKSINCSDCLSNTQMMEPRSAD